MDEGDVLCRRTVSGGWRATFYGLCNASNSMVGEARRSREHHSNELLVFENTVCDSRKISAKWRFGTVDLLHPSAE